MPRGNCIVALDLQKLNWFIERQVKLGKIAETDWEYFSQSDTDYLRSLYLREETDPSTRLYWIDDDDVRGFITSKVVHEISPDELFVNDLQTPFGMVSPPVVRPRDSDKEKQLFNAALNVLKQKKVTSIVCNVALSWGFKDLLEKNGFRPKSPLLQQAVIKVTDIPLESEETAIDCTGRYFQEKVEIFANNLRFSREYSKKIIENPPPFIEEVRDFCYITENLRAWARLTYFKGKWRMGPIYSTTIPDLKAGFRILDAIRRFLEQRGSKTLTIQCGKQAEHLLQNFGNSFVFEPEIMTYVLKL